MSEHRPQHDRRRDQFVATPSAAARLVSPAAVILAAAAILVAVVIFVTRPPAGSGSVAAQPAGAGQDISIPLGDLDDGQARFYQYASSSGRQVRFFVVKSSDGVARAAFDACDVCYRERRGYRQEGDLMICNACGQSFASRNINVLEGGCNPAPIERVVQDDRLVLRTSALEQGAFYF